jgi:hypothetical protein
MCPEADVREFSEKYLDELFDLAKAIRSTVFQHSSDVLPSLAQTCDSDDTRNRDIQWFSESWKAYKGLEERIKMDCPLGVKEYEKPESPRKR